MTAQSFAGDCMLRQECHRYGRSARPTPLPFSETRTAIQELGTRLSRLVGLLRAPTVALIEIRPAGLCTFVSDEWKQLTGQSRRQALGAGWQSAIHPSDAPPMMAAWARSLESGTAAAQRFRLLHTDGSIRWVYAHGAATAGKDHRFRFIAAIVDDAAGKPTAKTNRLDRHTLGGDQQTLHSLDDA